MVKTQFSSFLANKLMNWPNWHTGSFFFITLHLTLMIKPASHIYIIFCQQGSSTQHWWMQQTSIVVHHYYNFTAVHRIQAYTTMYSLYSSMAVTNETIKSWQYISLQSTLSGHHLALSLLNKIKLVILQDIHTYMIETQGCTLSSVYIERGRDCIHWYQSEHTSFLYMTNK